MKKKLSVAQQTKNLEIYETKIKPRLLNTLLKADERTHNVIVKHWDEFAQIKNPFGSNYLFGAVGSGKTVEAAWRMFEWARHKYMNGYSVPSIYFITTEDLLQEIRQSYDKYSEIKENEVIEKYSEANLLVLDEFGLEKTSEWHFRILYMIVNHRYRRLLPTIYTSNVDLPGLSKILQDDRIPSRIEHDCGKNIIKFINPSKRK